MMNPAYRVTIGQKVVDTTDRAQASTVVDLRVELDLDTPADSFTVTLANVNGLKPKIDDQAIVELGYADNGGFKQVLKGSVASVGPNLTTTRVVGHPASFTLLRRFVEQTYENKTAGAMVRDLCNRASVDVATADDGITFPAYVVDGRRSFYRHILDLAELSGLDAYINADGKLVFEKFVGGKTVHVFEYAKQILELEVHRAPALASQVTTFGESPGGGRGANAWAWLTRDFSGLKGTAGSGNSMLLLERSPLRTAEAARAAADAAFTTIDRRTLRGRLVTYGTPEVKLGDAIKLQQVPDDSLNRSFQVRGVKHRIHKVAGFTTTIEFRKIGD